MKGTKPFADSNLNVFEGIFKIKLYIIHNIMMEKWYKMKSHHFDLNAIHKSYIFYYISLLNRTSNIF